MEDDKEIVELLQTICDHFKRVESEIAKIKETCEETNRIVNTRSGCRM